MLRYRTQQSVLPFYFFAQLEMSQLISPFVILIRGITIRHKVQRGAIVEHRFTFASQKFSEKSINRQIYMSYFHV